MDLSNDMDDVFNFFTFVDIINDFLQQNFDFHIILNIRTCQRFHLFLLLGC